MSGITLDRGVRLLRRFGATEIKQYYLVSNYGYTFNLNGQKYDVRFWANCYGAYVGRWSGATKEIDDAFNEEIGESMEYWWSRENE